MPYNVGMKDKEIKIRADEEFIEKVDYLQRINGHKNRSETIRRTVEKEYTIYAPPYKWIPFTTFSDWYDWEGGNRLATIQNRFGQTFVTIVFLDIDISTPRWYVHDQVYAENWREGDFRLSHNWKVIALMPMPVSYLKKEKEDGKNS